MSIRVLQTSRATYVLPAEPRPMPIRHRMQCHLCDTQAEVVHCASDLPLCGPHRDGWAAWALERVRERLQARRNNP